MGPADDSPTIPSIRASCPDCGDVILSTSDLAVMVHAGSAEPTYAFRCPTCGLAASQVADPKVVVLLVTSGVRMALCEVPAEVGERRDGPPLSLDDMIDLHFELQDEGWFDRLRSIPSDGTTARTE